MANDENNIKQQQQEEEEKEQQQESSNGTRKSNSPGICSSCSRCLSFTCVGFILVPMVAYFVPFIALNLYNYYNQMPYDEYISHVKYDLFPKRKGGGVDGVDTSKFKTHVKVGDNNLLAKIRNGTNTSSLYYNYPYIFHKSDVRKWKALKWDMWNLSTTWHTLHGVISARGEDRNIIIESERDKGGMIGSIDTKLVENCLLAQFLGWSKFKEDSKLYITDFNAFENRTETSNHTRWRDLIIREPQAIKAGMNDSDISSSYIWMLYPNTSVQSKYTSYHTMRAQIKGDSYVALLPPGYASTLAPFPNLHVSYGHSQLRYVEKDAYEDKKVQHIVMKPGDLLYIPPYWNVRPRSLSTMSIGIDVSSASISQLHLLEAFYMNLPFDTEDIQRDDPAETKLRRIVAAQVFLLHFMSKVHKNPKKPRKIPEKNSKKKSKKKQADDGTISLIPNPADFMKKLYKIRYSSIIPEDSLFIQRHDFQCYRNEVDKYKEVYKSFIGSSAREGKEKAIEGATQYAANCVNEPVIENVVKTEWLYDYVEHMARWAMGSQDEAVFFIRECFNIDMKVYNKLLEEDQEVEGPNVLRFGDAKKK